MQVIVHYSLKRNYILGNEIKHTVSHFGTHADDNDSENPFNEPQNIPSPERAIHKDLIPNNYRLWIRIK